MIYVLYLIYTIWLTQIWNKERYKNILKIIEENNHWKHWALLNLTVKIVINPLHSRGHSRLSARVNIIQKKIASFIFYRDNYDHELIDANIMLTYTEQILSDNFFFAIFSVPLIIIEEKKYYWKKSFNKNEYNLLQMYQFILLQNIVALAMDHWFWFWF